MCFILFVVEMRKSSVNGAIFVDSEPIFDVEFSTLSSQKHHCHTENEGIEKKLKQQ